MSLKAAGAAHRITPKDASAAHAPGIAMHEVDNQGRAHQSQGAAPTLPFWLQSFECDTASPQLLSALPAASLTELKFTDLTTVQPQISEVFSRLKELRNLQFVSESFSTATPEVLFTNVKQLNQLTQLHLNGSYTTDGLSLLPQQLQNLTLDVWNSSAPVTFNLSHLTNLQQLSIYVDESDGLSVLPERLSQLEISCSGAAMSAFRITSLGQLNQLHMSSDDQPHDLLLLRHMQHLQTIKLRYCSVTSALTAVPAWGQLLHWKELELDLTGEGISTVQLASLLAAVSNLNKLTNLILDCSMSEDDAPLQEVEVAHVSICQSLTQLKGLASLILHVDRLVESKQVDMLHLATLNALTYLNFNLGYHPHQYLDGSVVTAVLLELTKLQHLQLENDINAQAFKCLMPVVARLQGLTHLELSTGEVGPEALDTSLMYLTKLRNLHELRGFHTCSNAAMRNFLDAMPSSACPLLRKSFKT